MQVTHYRFAGFMLDPGQRRLLNPAGAAVVLGGRAFELLLYFVQHPGETLQKDQLMAALWPDRVVEEGCLAKVLCALRAAIGDSSDREGGHGGIIQTFPGRGYRFAAAVTATCEHSGSEPGRAAGPATTWPAWPAWRLILPCLLLLLPLASLSWSDFRSLSNQGQTLGLAVLTFNNLNTNPDQARVLQELQDGLLGYLTERVDVPVLLTGTGADTASHEADRSTLATERQVSTVLDVSVRFDTGRIKVTAQLHEAASGVVLWSQSWTRPLAREQDLRSEVAVAAAAAITAASSTTLLVSTAD